MCGIFGIVADRNAPYTGSFLRRSLMTLARESQSRGKDSSGLVFRDEPKLTYHVIKGALKLGELLDSPVVKRQLQKALDAHSDEGPRSPFAAIGHSSNRATAIDTLCPPNPNELDRATDTSRCTLTFGAQSRSHSGSSSS